MSTKCIYTEARLKKRIFVASVLGVSAVSRTQFSLPYVSTEADIALANLICEIFLVLFLYVFCIFQRTY